MSDKLTFILRAAPNKSREMAKLAIDNSPDGCLIEIDKEPKKSKLQEEKYHACFDDIAKQCTHLNQCFDREGWKRLLLDQFRSDMLKDPTCDEDIRENLQHAVMMVPSLDGCSIVSIGLQSRKFKKKTASAFIEWLNAFAAQNDVIFKRNDEAK